MSLITWWVICILIFFSPAFSSKVYAHTSDYYAGYAKAIVDDFVLSEKTQISIEDRTLKVKIFGEPLDVYNEQKLKQRLEKLPFPKVQITYTGAALSKSISASQTRETISKTEENALEFLPSGAIYEAPIADPRWPKFAAGYQRRFDKRFQNKLFDLAFGDNLALVRKKSTETTYELGLQAGLFGLIDFSKAPTKLINSDYFIGAGVSILHNNCWQNLLQFSHLSSHLGDEILISNPSLIKGRVNLSYEQLKWLTAYKFQTLRPYVGLGYMVNRDPSTLRPLTLEGGVDYVSANNFLSNTGRYVLGVHTYAWKENNFKPSFSIRPGIQFENSKGNGRFLQVFLDLSCGQSRHGQFYYRKEQYIGLLVTISS